MRLRTVVALLLLTLTGSPLCAFDFDEARFARDVRNLTRLEKLSASLRDGMVGFAASNRSADRVTGEQHVVLDRGTLSYARIRNLLGDIAQRWEDATPSRGVRSEDLEDSLRGSLLLAATTFVMLENATTMVECFDGTIWERRLDQTSRGKGLEITDLFKDVAERLARGTYQKAIDRSLAFASSAGQRTASLAFADPRVAGLLAILSGYDEDLRTAGTKGFMGRVTQRAVDRLTSFKHRIGRRLSLLLTKWSQDANGLPYKGDLEKAEATGKLGRDLDGTRAELLSVLEPGDLILFKFKGDIWDKLIPGYFIHTTMWLGSYEEMTGLGLFDPGRNRISYPQAIEFQERIAAGRSILEADFVDVMTSPLDLSLCHYDTCVVLRLKDLKGMSRAERDAAQAGMVARGVRHLGQRYDFDFDVNTSDTIVCSELAYMAYPESVKWPVARRAGDLAITPDFVAFMAGPLDDQPLEVVYFNDEGASARGDEAWRALYRTLKATTETDVPTDEGADQDRIRSIYARIRP